MPEKMLETLEQTSIIVFTVLLLALGMFFALKGHFRIRKTEFKGRHVRPIGIIFLLAAALYIPHQQRGFFHQYSAIIQAIILAAGLLILWILSTKPKNTAHLPAGAFTSQSNPDEPAYRLHLRLNPDGTGIFILNASTVMHLNPSAAEFAFHMMKGTPDADIAAEISSRYRIHKDIVLRDYSEFRERIQTLIHTPDLDPVSFLDFERIAPHSKDLSAPLRLDCALTYQLPQGFQAEYAPVKRVEREMTTAEWKTILDKAWAAGIPHITFTGGEPTLRDDLPELIAHAEKNGQVCGLFSAGLKLADKVYLRQLLDTGLDHLLFLLQSEIKESWDAILNIIAEDLFITVHYSLTQENIAGAEKVIRKLADIGVKNLSLGIAHPSLTEQSLLIRNLAANLDMTLRWDLPVPYSKDNPISAEGLDDNTPEGAGKVWLYVEPDGDVLPSQGEVEKIMGNILNDSWETIFYK